jgi:hypothetical protein
VRRPVLLLSAACCLVAGCTSLRESYPQRTASEQMLISSAADRAAQNLALDLPAGAGVYVEAANFEGTDSRYALAAIREQLARQGARLMPSRDSADYVVEIRAGALSIDQEKVLVGIPELSIPLPLTVPLGIPEIALFKKEERRGVAKFAALAYDAKDGEFAAATAPQYGVGRETHWVFLILFGWTTSDYLPPEAREPWYDIEPPPVLPSEWPSVLPDE